MPRSVPGVDGAPGLKDRIRSVPAGAHRSGPAAGTSRKRLEVRIFGFAGWSGSGKTTLIERVIPRLTGRGLKVSLIKHAHHRFEIDRAGKDSYRLRDAGRSPSPPGRSRNGGARA